MSRGIARVVYTFLRFKVFSSRANKLNIVLLLLFFAAVGAHLYRIQQHQSGPGFPRIPPFSRSTDGKGIDGSGAAHQGGGAELNMSANPLGTASGGASLAGAGSGSSSSGSNDNGSNGDGDGGGGTAEGGTGEFKTRQVSERARLPVEDEVLYWMSELWSSDDSLTGARFANVFAQQLAKLTNPKSLGNTLSLSGSELEQNWLQSLASLPLGTLAHLLEAKMSELANAQRILNKVRAKWDLHAPFFILHKAVLSNPVDFVSDLQDRRKVAFSAIEEYRKAFLQKSSEVKAWGSAKADLHVDPSSDTETVMTLDKSLRCPWNLWAKMSEERKSEYSPLCFSPTGVLQSGTTDGPTRDNVEMCPLLSSSASALTVAKPTVFLVIGVLSSNSGYYRRHFIRSTWKKEAELLGVAVRFVFSSLEMDGLLAIEQAQFGDFLIIPGFVEYDSLVKKTFGIFLWACESFHFQYLLKTDDDSYINLPQILKHLAVYGSRSDTVVGFSYPNNFINPNKQSNLPIMQHVGVKKYPLYVSGSGTIYTPDTVRGFLAASHFAPLAFWPREDATVGVWLLAQQARKQHEGRVFPIHNDMYPCEFFVSHHFPAKLEQAIAFAASVMRCPLE